MNGFLKLCRAIKDRNKLAEALGVVERGLAATPWYRFGQRRRRLARIASLQRDIAVCSSKIDDEQVRALGNQVIWSLWDRAAREIIPRANPFGPAAEERFGEILDKAMDLGESYVVCEGDEAFPLHALPEVRSMVTRSSIGDAARRSIHDRAAIAASTELLHVYDRDHEGKKRLWVQHTASGLRATFTMGADGFGIIKAKSTVLGSIDPDRHGTMDIDAVNRVAGLRIGQQIYEEAHRLEPDVRWAGGAFSGYSGPLRRRLHNADPYVWSYGSCQWCDQNGIHDWTKALPSTFAGHPK